MRQEPSVTSPVRPRRGRRALLWLLGLCACAGLLYAAAGMYVPPAVDAAIARSVRRQFGAPAQVSLDPGPIWQLALGRFDRLQIRMAKLSYQGTALSDARLVWRGGQVDLSALARGRLVIVRKGSLVVSGAIGAKEVEQALTEAARPYLPAGSAVTLPQVEISPQGISLDGSIDVLGVPIPYRLAGVLTIAPGGTSIVFHARSLNESSLALPAVPILKAQQIPKVDGIAWRFEAVTLRAGSVYVALRSAT